MSPSPAYDFILADGTLFRVNRTTGEAWRVSSFNRWYKIEEKGE
jgi:hypothetical protein